MNFDHRKRKDIEFVKSQLPTNFIGDEERWVYAHVRRLSWSKCDHEKE